MRICAWRPSIEIVNHYIKDEDQLVRLSSESELERAIQDRHFDAVLLELGTDAMDAMRVVERAAVSGAVNRPIIAVVPSTAVAFRQLLCLLQFRLEVRIALKTLCDDVKLQVLKPEKGTIWLGCGDRMSAMLAPSLTIETSSIVLPAILVGCRRSKCSALEDACGLPGRTLRGGVARLRLPRPSRLLGLVMGSSVAFHTDEGFIKLSGVAQRLGFDTTDELRRYLVRRTSLTPSGWRSLGFGASVQLLADRFSFSRV